MMLNIRISKSNFKSDTLIYETISDVFVNKSGILSSLYMHMLVSTSGCGTTEGESLLG